MNLKRAKTMRRAAEAATLGAPKVKYQGRKNSRGWFVQIRVDPACTRGVYRGFKKTFMQELARV
jgi:hypothetical protein